jgi:hypothetical protein
MIGAAVVQLVIGPLFDKTAELVKQAVQQFAEAMQKVVSEVIIPKARTSGTVFANFMSALSDYLLQDDEQAASKGKPKAAKFDVGEGELAVSFAVDTSAPMTDSRQNAVMLDLANDVLAIDEVVPTLKSDLSLYNDLAMRAGVFSGDTMNATPTDPLVSGTRSTALDKPFTVSKMTVGDTRFDVPAGGSVAVTAKANYTDPNWQQMAQASRPPSSYGIDLYAVKSGRHGDRAVGPMMKYSVGKSESGQWHNLGAGQYYLVFLKGGNPSFVLEGDVHIDVRKP